MTHAWVLAILCQSVFFQRSTNNKIGAPTKWITQLFCSNNLLLCTYVHICKICVKNNLHKIFIVNSLAFCRCTRNKCSYSDIFGLMKFHIKIVIRLKHEISKQTAPSNYAFNPPFISNIKIGLSEICVNHNWITTIFLSVRDFFHTCVNIRIFALPKDLSTFPNGKQMV